MPKREKKTQQRPRSQSLPAPDSLVRKYSTSELIFLFEDALARNYSTSHSLREDLSSLEDKEHFMRILHLKMHQEAPHLHHLDKEDLKDIQIETFIDPRISREIDSLTIPKIEGNLFKRFMTNWIFFDADEPLPREIRDNFKEDFLNAYTNIMQQLKSLTLNKTNRLQEISKYFDSRRAFQNASQLYGVEMLMVRLIMDLTVKGFEDEAKVLHLFISVLKRINIQSDLDVSEQEANTRMVAPSLLSGLKIDVDTVNAAELYMFTAGMLNLALSNPVFDYAYDKEIYLLYNRLNQMCNQEDIIIECNPRLLSTAIDSPIVGIVKRHYKDIIDDFFPRQENGLELPPRKNNSQVRDDAVLNFFVNAIAVSEQYESNSKAESIHNVLFLLAKLYREDEGNANAIELYSKMIRILFKLPSVDNDNDHMFVQAFVRRTLGLSNQSHFMKPYHHSEYHLVKIKTKAYCRDLGKQIYDMQLANSALRDKVRELEDNLDAKDAECNSLKRRLENAQQRIRNLTLSEESQSDTSASIESPQTTPSTSPTNTRKILHRFTKHKEKPHTTPPYSRALSESELIKTKKKFGSSLFKNQN